MPLAVELLRCEPMGSRRLWAVAAVVVVLPASFLWLRMPARRDTLPSFPEPRPAQQWKVDPARAREYRHRALKQARTFRATDPRSADFSKNPPDSSGLLSTDPVQCRHVDKHAGGTSPKFDCVLSDGEVVKVKYGLTKEINAEIAATRFLDALGFAADRVYSVPRLRCYGCPREPYYTTKTLDYVHARGIASKVPEEGFTDFEWVAVERHFAGVTIEAEDDQGWAWFELKDADTSNPALRPERDALRLAAMLLAHWDNKASNQRLMCRTPDATGPCPDPVALIHDVGSTFGPGRVDLEAWTKAPIWADRAHCRVSMKMFPYGGGTFADTQISERGRQLFARQLAALTDTQLTTLFAAARFPELDGEDRSHADAWSHVLRAKIREIVDGRPCPSA
jgi:hypothetical protein